MKTFKAIILFKYFFIYTQQVLIMLFIIIQSHMFSNLILIYLEVL